MWKKVLKAILRQQGKTLPPRQNNSSHKVEEEVSIWRYPQSVIDARTLSVVDVKKIMLKLGTFKPESAEWISPLINSGMENGYGYAKVSLIIRKNGRLLTKEELKPYGIRGNAHVGSDFLASLTDKGLKDPLQAIMQLVSFANTGSAYNATLQSFKKAEALAPSLGLKLITTYDKRTCRAARALEGTIFKSSNCPILPLPNCDADMCRCTVCPTEKD